MYSVPVVSKYFDPCKLQAFLMILDEALAMVGSVLDHM